MINGHKFLQATGCPACQCHPTNSVNALNAFFD